MLEQGIVKRFSAAKGFGFITRPNGKGEAFVHHSSIIDMPGYRTLDDGAAVEYEVRQGPKGFEATNVRLI